MQRMPFAFLLQVELWALMHKRTAITAISYDILLLYYHSWSPVRLINAWDLWNLHCTICAVYSVLNKNSARTLYRTVGCIVWRFSDPSHCSAPRSEGLLCFHDATCLAASRVLEPTKRPDISPNVLWLEFWSFKIFLPHLFSLLSLSFSLFLLSSSLCFSLSVCVSHRITE